MNQFEGTDVNPPESTHQGLELGLDMKNLVFALECGQALSLVFYALIATIIFLSIPQFWMKWVDRQQLHVMANKARDELFNKEDDMGLETETLQENSEPEDQHEHQKDALEMEE